MLRFVGFCALALLPLASLAADEDKTADELTAARTAYAKQLEDGQKKFLAAVDAEIEKAAKSGSLDAVKSLQAEKTAIEANFEYDSKVTKLRPAVTRYRAEAKAAKDKLKASLGKAVSAYTKELKIAEAESIDAELKALVAGKPPAATGKPAVTAPPVADVKPGDLKNGAIVTLYGRLPVQKDNEGFVLPTGLGKPLGDPAVIESLDEWGYDAEKNAVASCFLKIETAGEYEFRTYNFYDRNALFIAGQNVCPYRGSVTGGSEPAGKEKITLRKGMALLVSVGYVDARGSVAVTWKPPGQKDFSPIPKELLFYDSSKIKMK